MSTRELFTRKAKTVALARGLYWEEIKGSPPGAKKKIAPGRGRKKGTTKVTLKGKGKNAATESNGEYAVESILDVRTRNGSQEFLVKWVGYPRSEATWEPERNLTDCAEKMKEFMKLKTKDMPVPLPAHRLLNGRPKAQTPGPNRPTRKVISGRASR